MTFFRRKTNSQKLFREEEGNPGQRDDLRDPNVASAGPCGQLIAPRGHAAGQGAEERGRGHGGTDNIIRGYKDLLEICLIKEDETSP